jgi:hypothetical protein
MAEQEFLPAGACVVPFLAGESQWNQFVQNPDHVGKTADLRQLKESDLARVRSIHGYHFPGPTLFDGVVFPEGFTFISCRFFSTVSFRGATLGKGFGFNGTDFTDAPLFASASLGESFRIQGGSVNRCMTFEGLALPKGTRIEGVNFPNGIAFENTTLHHFITFYGCAVSVSASFSGQVFNGGAAFNGCTFYCCPIFNSCRFAGDVDFSGTTCNRGIDFRGATVEGAASFRSVGFSEEANFAGASFMSAADFSGSAAFTGEAKFIKTRFGANVKFNGRTFAAATSFTRATFAKPPEFFRATLYPDTDFNGATFAGLDSDNAERCFRTLKLAMSEHQAHREELMFFALEMQAHANREPSWRTKWLYRLYGGISNYGQSVLRPTKWLLGTLVLSLIVYLLAIDLPHNYSCVAEPNCWRTLTVRWPRLSAFVAFTLSQSVPFINVFRDGATAVFKELFDGDPVPYYVQFVAVLQGIASLVFFFLIGLGLRNLFRLK